MPIVVNVDVMLARRKMTSAELADKIGLSAVNLSILKTGKAKGVRFSTLDALCKALECQPGDLLEFRENAECQTAGTLPLPACWQNKQMRPLR